MAIPKHDEIRIEALRLLQLKGILKLKEFEAPLARIFGLSDDELNEQYDSGKNGTIFYDRIAWALSYLNISNLVDKPKRGEYRITDIGLNLLKTPEKIEIFVQEAMKNRNRDRVQISTTKEVIFENEHNELTPSEAIQNAFAKIKAKVYDEIIDTIISKTPREFEKLVVMLLQKMGYGGELKDSGEVTKQSNDEGIDGIIKEDVLGFGRIYIQAKRYARDNRIGREDLNKFVGALAVAQSNKGVFITTSSFNKNAIDYAKKLTNSTTLVLIDGEQLAKYIYDYSLGMQSEQIIEIKRLDGDFWDMLEDETKIS